jgi:hypothetical protein
MPRTACTASPSDDQDDYIPRNTKNQEMVGGQHTELAGREQGGGVGWGLEYCDAAILEG